MSLEKQIIEQYGKRKEGSLYNSYYSNRAALERDKVLNRLLMPIDCSNKLILEIGAGHGGNVVSLEQAGFQRKNIHLNELLSERIHNIKLHQPDLKLFEGDFLNLKFEPLYDFLFQSTVFTSVLEDTMRKEIADKMWSLIKPGGFVLWYDFVYNNPSNKNVRKVSVAELKGLFPGASSFKIEKVTLAPPIGRRVGKLYGLFNLPILRTHILALLQKT